MLWRPTTDRAALASGSLCFFACPGVSRTHGMGCFPTLAGNLVLFLDAHGGEAAWPFRCWHVFPLFLSTEYSGFTPRYHQRIPLYYVFTNLKRYIGTPTCPASIAGLRYGTDATVTSTANGKTERDTARFFASFQHDFCLRHQHQCEDEPLFIMLSLFDVPLSSFFSGADLGYRMSMYPRIQKAMKRVVGSVPLYGVMERGMI